MKMCQKCVKNAAAFLTLPKRNLWNFKFKINLEQNENCLEIFLLIQNSSVNYYQFNGKRNL